MHVVTSGHAMPLTPQPEAVAGAGANLRRGLHVPDVSIHDDSPPIAEQLPTDVQEKISCAGVPSPMGIATA